MLPSGSAMGGEKATESLTYGKRVFSAMKIFTISRQSTAGFGKLYKPNAILFPSHKKIGFLSERERKKMMKSCLPLPSAM